MDEKKVDPEREAAVKVLAKLAIRKLSTTTAHDMGYRVKTMHWATEVLKNEAHALACEVNDEVARLQMLALASLADAEAPSGSLMLDRKEGTVGPMGVNPKQAYFRPEAGVVTVSGNTSRTLSDDAHMGEHEGEVK